MPLDTILNSLDEAVLCIDDRLTLVFLNEAAARIFPTGHPDPAGQSVSDFPALADAVRQLNLGELTVSGPSAKTVRRLQVRPGGAPPVLMEAVVSCTEHGGQKLYTAVLHDPSAQQQLEREVYESRKTLAIGALASGIAHDFNNLLTGVISQIDLALHAPEFPATLKDHLVHAQTSARRGAELVGKLQAFSHQGRLILASVDPTEVIEQALFMLRHSIDPIISIHSPKTPHRPWRVKADPNQILQALLNLAVNARDAMPRGGTMTIA